MGVGKQIKPQEGFQERVLSCTADIAVIGGSAGCGKSFCLMYEPLRYATDPRIKGFNGITFRRNLTEIRSTGGLWQKATELYGELDESIRPEPQGGNTHFRFKFPSGADLQLAHLHHKDTAYTYQGTELTYIAFDELTHFEEEQFFYILSRNRSTCGVSPYVRASTNPQGEGWVKRLIEYWIYPDDYHIEELRGAPIHERQGKIMFMARRNNKVIMKETKAEVQHIFKEELGIDLEENNIRSFTFIAGRLSDNQILMKKDPGYLGNLMQMSEQERTQLYDGCWILVDDDELALLSKNAISDLYTNFVDKGKARYITADVAFEGADRFVIAIWEGWVLVEFRVFDKSLGDEVLNEIKKAASDWKVPFRNIAFDATGIGGAYKGFLRTSVAVVSGAVPMRERPVQGANGQKAEPKIYFNLRSQLYFNLREVVENCDMLIADERYRLEVEQELKAIKKMEIKADGKLRIVPKDQIRQALGRSPDFADVISMRCVFDLLPPINVKERISTSF
ncbi:MAG: terminase large subunit domain-containing protein [Shewanella sp.]